jgi:hypothetical protein
MIVDDALVIGAITAMATAITALWWHFERKITKLEARFECAIKQRCIHGATEPRWCQRQLHKLLPQTDKITKTALEPMAGKCALLMIIVLLMSGCFVRIPVEVVQYKEDKPLVVAPVGEAFVSPASATQPQKVVMNPRVIEPENVGQLPPKPEPIGGGIDWLALGLGILAGTGPLGYGLSVALSALKKARTANEELVHGAQAIKEQSPDTAKEISMLLASKQSDSTKDIVKKIKSRSKKGLLLKN